MAVADGSEEIELASVVDVLRRAEANVTIAKVDWSFCELVDGKPSKMSVLSRGMKVEADALLDEKLMENEFDAVVMPGGLPGSEHFSESPLFVKKLKYYLADDTKIVGSICATPAMVLQEHGLLEGYDKVTCHPFFADQIDPAQYTDAHPVVKSKNLITSQGPGTAIEFAAALVEALYGEEKAKEVASPLILKSNPTFYQH